MARPARPMPKVSRRPGPLSFETSLTGQLSESFHCAMGSLFATGFGQWVWRSLGAIRIPQTIRFRCRAEASAYDALVTGSSAQGWSLHPGAIATALWNASVVVGRLEGGGTSAALSYLDASRSAKVWPSTQ